MYRFAFAALALGAFLAPAAARADVTLTAAGSTALLPLFKSDAALYENRHPEVKITVTGGGSRAGLAAVAAGNADLGMSDTAATGYPDLVDHHICVVGFTVLLNPAAGVSNLTRKQLQDVFAGKVANWKEVGGADVKILTINRGRATGTRQVFVRAIMGSVPLAESGIVEDSTPTLLDDLRSTPGAISYAAFTSVKTYKDGTFAPVDGLRELTIDGAAPTEEDIGSGRYPLWSYEHAYTNGQAGKDASRFLALLESDADALHALGFIPLREMKIGASDR